MATCYQQNSWNPKDDKCMLNKCALNVEGNNHWQHKIRVVHDFHTQIHHFVVVETHVTVMPLKFVGAYATILNSSLPTNCSNEN